MLKVGREASLHRHSETHEEAQRVAHAPWKTKQQRERAEQKLANAQQGQALLSRAPGLSPSPSAPGDCFINELG